MSGTVGNPVGRRTAGWSPVLTGPVLTGAGLAALTGYVVAVDPSDGPGLVPCPFRATTGLWCPGCGLTRATHHLFHGDVGDALRYNLLIVPLLVVIGLSWATWLAATTGHRVPGPAVRGPVRQLVAWGAVAVAVVFAVVRNLPGVAGLRG